MSSLHGFLHGIQWIMFHGHLDYFQEPPLGGRPNTKLEDLGTPNAHYRLFILFYHVWGPAWIEIHWNSIQLRVWLCMASHYTSRSVTTLHDYEVSWNGPWILSFGFSQFYGHGSWLMCEVALMPTNLPGLLHRILANSHSFTIIFPPIINSLLSMAWWNLTCQRGLCPWKVYN